MEAQYIDILSVGCSFTDDRDVIDSLKDSISQQGQHHPIIVQERDHPGMVIKYRIIAGRKRLQAMFELKTKEISAKILPANLTDDQCLEISLHENIKRYNLPWYEEVQKKRELHELRQRMNGVAKPGTPRLSSKDKGWSQADTAKELQMAVGAFSQDLYLANALDANPSLKKVKDKTTALRLVKQQTKRIISEAESLLPSEMEMNQVFLGDSYDILSQFPSGIFDACITDPPWSEYQRDKSLTMDDSTVRVFEQVFRTLKSDSFLYLITSITDFYLYLQELPKFGFKCQSYPIMWQKTRTITHGRHPWEYARDYEPILIAVKGSPVLVPTTEQSAILSYENLHYTKMIHPHEKPTELIKKIISDCTYEGGKILEPFAGSGVVLSTAKEMNRTFIGIEREKSFYDNICRRLEK